MKYEVCTYVCTMEGISWWVGEVVEELCEGGGDVHRRGVKNPT